MSSTFFAKSYILPRRYLARISSKEWDFSLTFRGLFLLGVPLSPILVPLAGAPLFCCTLIVSQLGRFVKRFFHPSVMGLEPLGSDTSLQPRPLTMIVYHTPLTKSIGNVAQIRDICPLGFCAIFLLTNSERCDIMEISRASSESARLEKIKCPR